jgi:anti-sigma B factor antagonist
VPDVVRPFDLAPSTLATVVAAAPSLSLSHRRDGPAITVVACGVIDLATAQQLETELTDAAGTDTAVIVVDLNEVTLLDAVGVRTLIRGRRIADAHGRHYRIGGAHGLVRQVLDIAGVWSSLSGPVGLTGPQWL